MNKKLEESLGLDPIPDASIEEASDAVIDVETAIQEAKEIYNALDITEKIDHALATVENLQEHDREMDEISEKALQTFQDLCDMSVNLQDNYVARVYEVAGSFLKTALDAREAKLNRKLKTLDLQLKKAALDNNQKSPDDNPANRNEFDRNMVLKMIRDSGKQNDKN